jgi:hypothetical protein
MKTQSAVSSQIQLFRVFNHLNSSVTPRFFHSSIFLISKVSWFKFQVYTFPASWALCIHALHPLPSVARCSGNHPQFAPRHLSVAEAMQEPKNTTHSQKSQLFIFYSLFHSILSSNNRKHWLNNVWLCLVSFIHYSILSNSMLFWAYNNYLQCSA